MAAVDYFLKIDGIPGESDDAKHQGEVEVLAWSWGETATAPSGSGGGAGAGKVTIQDLHFTARISKASPQLMLACASGKHIKSAVLTARRGGEAQAEFLIVTLEEVLVSSYQTATGGEDRSAPIDSIALNFSRIQVEYRETNPDGTLGPPVKFGWDVNQNRSI
ncbi:MAG: type VI secretion system tube protein Hcp [Actinomycetota bacterium]|nr:type VI secretion system tube protein Hcp [Actinomycetota bacterium]